VSETRTRIARHKNPSHVVKRQRPRRHHNTPHGAKGISRGDGGKTKISRQQGLYAYFGASKWFIHTKPDRRTGPCSGTQTILGRPANAAATGGTLMVTNGGSAAAPRATTNAAVAISHMMWTERRPYNGGTKTARSAPRTRSSCGLLPLTAEQRLGRRRLLLRVATFLPAKELLLDLQRDSIQPFLCSICPVLVIPDRAFKLAYPVFCRTQLRRQLMSHFKSLLVLCIGSGRCAVNQSQNRLGCLVDAIRGLRSAVWLWRELNDCLCGDLPTITHSHPPHSLPDREFHHWRHFEAMRRPVDNSRLLVSVASMPTHQPTPPQAGSLISYCGAYGTT
jgi:hypothetical protein